MKWKKQKRDALLKVIINQTALDFKEETMAISEQVESRGSQKGIHSGIKQGMQQGFQKSEHEKTFAIARNMLSGNLDINVIKEVTGLYGQYLSGLVKSN